MAIMVVGAVFLGPITEEVLYRDLILGTSLAQGFGIASAVALMTALFAALYLPNFEVTGTLFVSVRSLLPVTSATVR